MSFDSQRDIVNKLDQISRQLSTLIDLVREQMGKPEPGPGWLAGMSDEEYKRRFRRRRTSGDSGASNLPPSGGVPPEEFFARRER